MVIRRPSATLQDVEVEVAVTMDRDKIKELVTTEISLERQLESVQSQLLALKQLPSEIEKHLKIVSEQLHKIMELSGVEAQEAAQAKGERSKVKSSSGQVVKKASRQGSRCDERNP